MKLNKIVDSQPIVATSGNEKSIFGLSVKEEDKQIYNKMKKEEEQDKAKQFLNQAILNKLKLK